MLCLLEKPLVNPFVNDNKCNLWLLDWELLLEDLLEVIKFFCLDLLSHGITYTISEDDDMLHMSLIVSGILIDSTDVALS